MFYWYATVSVDEMVERNDNTEPVLLWLRNASLPLRRARYMVRSCIGIVMTSVDFYSGKEIEVSLWGIRVLRGIVWGIKCYPIAFILSIPATTGSTLRIYSYMRQPITWET